MIDWGFVFQNKLFAQMYETLLGCNTWFTSTSQITEEYRKALKHFKRG